MKNTRIHNRLAEDKAGRKARKAIRARKDNKHPVTKLAKEAEDAAKRGNTAITNSGWRDKLTGKPTFAPPGTSAYSTKEREKERRKET